MSARNKKKARFPLKYIAVLTAVVWIATSFVLDLPPASWIQHTAGQAPEAMNAETANTPFPDKPPFGFGSRALAGVCSEYGLDTDSAIRELEGFAINAEPEWSIKRIAAENDMEAAALFEVIREVSLDRGQPLDMLD